MKKEDVFVSVVAPLRNASPYVAEVVRETADMLREHYANYEVVLVDDGSEDDTAERVRALLAEIPCLRMIRLSRAFGMEIAAGAGLESAIGDFVVVMNPRSDPPRLIPAMVEKCRSGAGIVTGISKSTRPRPALGRAGAALFHWYTRRYLHIDLVPGATDFRVLSRQAVNAVTQIKDRYRQLRLLTATVGFRSHTFEYEPVARGGAPARPSWWGDLTDAIDIVVANSMHPLRVVSRLGLLASGLNLLYLCYVVAVYLIKKDVMEGWTTLSFQHGVMFFMIFCILTVLCEYCGRILEETRNRPLYFINDELNSSVLLSDESRRNVVRESAAP